jgi:hypothetical protein
MSRGLYNYCRPPDGDPIIVSEKLIIQSSRQLQSSLLCNDCDASLSINGENWTLPLLATIEGTFPFFDILEKFPPDCTDGDSKVYAASRNPEIDIARLTHFAMGIFWKASVHSWRGNETIPLIDLGEFREPIRLFLRGESSFPTELTLTIGVSPRPVKIIGSYAPYRGSAINYPNFLFYVPGIEFALETGRNTAVNSKGPCFANNPAHPILVCDLDSTIKDVIRSGTARAHRAKNLKRYLNSSKD